MSYEYVSLIYSVTKNDHKLDLNTRFSTLYSLNTRMIIVVLIFYVYFYILLIIIYEYNI